jgi:heme/copper-type cytochrome/quinol oxidase subunit 3
MTGIRLKGKRHEEVDTTYGPFIVAMGLLAMAVTLTAMPVLALGALALILLGSALWLRESVKENRRLRPIEVEHGEPEATGIRVPSVHWWGAVGFGLIQLMVFGAAVRVAHAHGLLHPDVPRVTTLWIGHGMSAVAVVSVLFVLWAIREARYGSPVRMSLSVGAVLLTALVQLGLLVVQVMEFEAIGVFAEDLGKRSALLWLYLVYGAAVLTTVIAFLVLLIRIFLGPLEPEHYGPTQGLMAFWGTVLLSWVVFYVVFYLRWIQTRFQLI